LKILNYLQNNSHYISYY